MGSNVFQNMKLSSSIRSLSRTTMRILMNIDFLLTVGKFRMIGPVRMDRTNFESPVGRKKL